MMDRQYIDDHHLVARYLADQLTDQERAQFEAYLLEQPDLVRELEAAARFKVGLGALADQGQLDQVIHAKRANGLRWFALAATIVLTLGAGLIWFGRTPTSGPILTAMQRDLVGQDGRALPLAASIRVLRTRGAHDAEIVIPAAPAVVELQILPPHTASPAGNRVVLYREAQGAQRTMLAEVFDADVDAQGYVVAFLRADRLEPGRYALTIGPRGAASQLQSEYFISVRQAAPGTDPR